MLATIALSIAASFSSFPVDYASFKWGSRIENFNPPAGYAPRHTERGYSLAWVRDEVVMTVSYLPNSKRIWEITFIAGQEVGYSQAYHQYTSHLSNLIARYGRPTETYRYLLPPFDKTIGYFNTALSQGKVNISDFWNNRRETFIGSAITPEGWTCVTFESKEFSPYIKPSGND